MFAVLLAFVPILRMPVVWVVAISNNDEILIGSQLAENKVPLVRVFPQISKLNAGFSVLIPIKPAPPAANKEILSAVAAAVGSFSTPIVRRPAFVVPPDKSWYLMYA